jgi:pilus assembly protein CpaF
MFAIVVNEKGGEQKRLEFDKPEVTIGRVQGNDIILPKGNVSKRHSRIVLKDGKFIIVDLKSTNGTYVNGRKITSPLVVKGQDKIYIGDFILSIEEGVGASAGMDDGPPTPPPPPQRKSLPVPPPPPRRPLEEEALDEGADDEPRGARATAPQQVSASLPVRAPSQPAMPAAPVPRPSPLGEAPRPPSRPLTMDPVPRPAAPAPMPPRPAPAPAPSVAPPLRRPQAPPPGALSPRMTAPLGSRAAMVGVDDVKRARITEFMRELSLRLQSHLGLDGSFVSDDAVWGRAERAAAELVDGMPGELALPPGVDTDGVLRDVVAETLGLGALEELLVDETVREISAPRFDRVYVDRGQMQLAPKWFSSPEAMERVIERWLQRAGRGAQAQAARNDGALIEARLDNGLLLTAALPPLAAQGPALMVRRARRNASRLADLVSQGMLSQQMGDFLDLAVRGRRNILVAGPGGSGRSTLLAALARAAEGERVVSVAESDELDPGEGTWTALVGRGAAAGRALGQALRFRPQRLVVDDVRGAEALELVSALAAGFDGTAFALQAASPREAVLRLQSMARLAEGAPSSAALAEEIGRAVQVVVQLGRSLEGEPRVVEISDITEGGVDGALMTPVFSFRPEGGGRFTLSGHVPAWAEGAPPSIFRA